MSFKIRTLLFLAFLSVSSVSPATKYYIDSVEGSDLNDGLTTAKPWKTLSKIYSSSFSPGDSILLKRDRVWRETLTVPVSGSPAKYIYFSGYGSGAKPRILGSNTTTWTNQGGNVWVSDQLFINPWGSGRTSEIFFINTDHTTSWGIHRTSTDGLAGEYEWTWEANRIYVYSLSDPDIRYLSVEIPQRMTIIEPNDRTCLHFDGIDLFYSESEGFGDGSYPNKNLSGLIIENCHIAFMGSRAAVVGYGTTPVYSDMIIRKDTIHDCGRRSISLNLYASGFTVRTILVEGNVLYNGSHTTGVDINIGTGSFTGSIDDITIRKNLIFEEPHRSLYSELIFAQNYRAGGTLTNLFIYGNIFRYPTISGIKLENVQSAYIYNNTFYGHNLDKSGNTYHIFVDAGSTNIKIKNNIFYTTLNTDASGSGLAIFKSVSQDSKQIDSDYNLYYRTSNNLRIIVAGTANYYQNSFSSVNSQLGWELHSPAPSDPQFDSDTDLRLKEGSPAIGKGLKIDLIKTDFGGNNYNDPPSIGAFEGNPQEEPVIPGKILIIYPNPTTGTVNIVRSGSSTGPLKYQVFSISGKLVQDGIIETAVNSFNLHLGSGVYIIRIIYNDLDSATQKLVFVE